LWLKKPLAYPMAKAHVKKAQLAAWFSSWVIVGQEFRDFLNL